MCHSLVHLCSFSRTFQGPSCFIIETLRPIVRKISSYAIKHDASCNGMNTLVLFVGTHIMYLKLPVNVVQYKHKSFPFIYKLNSMIQFFPWIVDFMAGTIDTPYLFNLSISYLIAREVLPVETYRVWRWNHLNQSWW